MEPLLRALRSPVPTAVVPFLCTLGSLSLMASGLPELFASVQGKGIPVDPVGTSLTLSAMALDNLVGLCFSHLLGDTLAFRLRVASSVLTVVYAVHLVAATRRGGRRGTLLTLSAAPSSFLLLSLVLHAAVPPSRHIDVLGLVNTCTAIAFAASPLSRVVTILRLQDASSIPLPMSSALLLTAASWTVYGAQLGNAWIVLPNALNTVLAAAQVGLVYALPGPGLTTSALTPRGTHAAASWVTLSPTLSHDSGEEGGEGSEGDKHSPEAQEEEEEGPEGADPSPLPIRRKTTARGSGQKGGARTGAPDITAVGSPAQAAMRRAAEHAASRSTTSRTH